MCVCVCLLIVSFLSDIHSYKLHIYPKLLNYPPAPLTPRSVSSHFLPFLQTHNKILTHSYQWNCVYFFRVNVYLLIFFIIVSQTKTSPVLFFNQMLICGFALGLSGFDSFLFFFFCFTTELHIFPTHAFVSNTIN